MNNTYWKCKKMTATEGCHLMTNSDDRDLILKVVAWLNCEITNVTYSDAEMCAVMYLYPLREKYIN